MTTAKLKDTFFTIDYSTRSVEETDGGTLVYKAESNL